MHTKSLRLIDFFIIGVQKGGTTALHRYLQMHPAIQMPQVKELQHFNNERLDWSTPNADILNVHFDWSAKNELRGEATPIYIYWPSALSRLKRYNSDAKLIVVLRHPTFRAFSHWRMEAERKAESLTFEEAISDAGRARVAASPGGVHRVYSYIERGFYADQIERLFALFPRNQIFFLRTDELWSNVSLTLTRTETFLNVENILGSITEHRYIAPVDGSNHPPMALHSRQELDRLFADDIRRTGELTGLDLRDWLDPEYREPMENI